MKIFLLISILSLGAFSIAAQAPTPDKCPSIEVIGPSTISSPGDTIEFKAGIKNYAHPENLSYNWLVSLGEIVKGQGTSAIQVKKPEDSAGSNVTATVEIIGLPAGCENKASETEPIDDRSAVTQDVDDGVACDGRPYTVDEFGRIPIRSDMKARIDNFFIVFNKAPGNFGLISIHLDKNESARRRLAYVNQIYSLAAELKPGLKDIYFSVYKEQDYTAARLQIFSFPPNLNEIDKYFPESIPASEFKSRIPKLLAPRSKK